MAAKPETTFTRSINRLIKEVYVEKTNNPFRSGIADSWYSGIKSDIWVEYKYVPSLPKTKPYAPNLSPRQVKWLGDRHAEGRGVYVILGLPEGGVLYMSPTDWGMPRSAAELRKRILTRRELADWIFTMVGTSPCKSSEPSPELPSS